MESIGKSESSSGTGQVPGIVSVADAFDGIEELRVRDGAGHRLLKIEAESGVIDQELLEMLNLWLSHRPAGTLAATA